MKKTLSIIAIIILTASVCYGQFVNGGGGGGADSRIGTLTNTKWCASDGTSINCTEDAPAGSGDITAVGSCATGSCAQIGNADTSAGYIDFLEDSDNGTNYVRLIGAASTADVTVTLPATTGTLMLTTGSPAAMVIASQAQGDLLYASSGTAWARLGAGTAGNPLISGGAAANPSWLGVVMAGGTNTFSITNGTASLDVAAGATLNIDTSLAVNTAAVTLVGKSGGSSLTLPTAISFDGTHADGRICTYASTGTVVSCNTATSTFQTADADLTTIAAITATRGDLMYGNASGAWGDLAIGAANTVLTTDGTDPAWATITSAMITDNTITATDLAATLTFADGDFVDLSGVTMSGTNDEGITLPFWADVTPTSGATKRFMTWDESGSVLKIYTASGWTTINPSAGAPTDVAYLVTGSLSGSLSAERLLAEGLAIDFTDAGANGNFTIAFDPTELTGNRTFAAGGAAAVTWTWDNSGTTDPALTFGDGLISSNSSLLPATNDGAALGNTSYMWSDLFLASGSVVNFNNGDVTLTHSENTLTLGGGTLALGANSLTMTGSIAATGNRVTKGWFTDIESTNAPSVGGTAANATGGLITNPMTTAGDLITGAASGAATGRIAAVAAGQPLLSGGVGTASAYAGYTFSGTASQTYTFPGATDTLAGLATAQTFTANNVFGNADTDTLTLRSLVIGGNSRAVWIAATAPTPTYATGTNELYVAGDIESGGTIYAANFQTTGTGESYLSMANNASGRSPTAASYEIWFETDTTDQLKYSLNGTEKAVVNVQDAQTISGIKTHTAAVYFGDASTGGSVRFYDGSSNYAAIAVPSLSADYTLTLPTTDGNSGQYLKTDGSGALSWDSPTATAAGSDTQVQFNDGGSALGGDAGFTFTKATSKLTLGASGGSTTGTVELYYTGTANAATITPASMSSDITITLPAATGTLATLGNAETFSGAKTFSANVTLDDGSGASPSLTFTDATDETAVFSKVDAGYLTITTVAGDGVNILVGNLKVGNGSPGQTIDGEDAYIEGLLEVDGVIYADGGITAGGTVALGTNNLTISTGYIALGADPADAGSIRLPNAGSIQFEADAAGTDVNALSVDSAEIVQIASAGASGVTITPDVTITGGDIILISATAGAGITAGDGTLSLKGLGSGTDEIMTIDLNSANLITIASTTDATFAFTPNVAFTADVEVGDDLAMKSDGAIITFGADSEINLTHVADTGLTTNGDFQVGDDLLLKSDGAVLKFGADDDVTLTHVADTALLLNSSRQLQFGDSGTYINQSADGTLAVVSDTNVKIVVGDDDLNFADGGTDIITVSSNTSVTKIDFSALNLATTGIITGAVNTNADANGMSSAEMTAAGLYGTMFWATGAGTWALPSAATGMSFCVYSTTAAAVVINPDDGDTIVLNGTALSAGDSITSASAAGDFICLLAKDANTWYTLGRSGTWTDTN